MKKLKIKINKWFFNTFVKRYLATVDPTLLSLFTKKVKGDDIISPADRVNAENRIIKKLSSKKYKKFFHNAILYDRNKQHVEVIRPYGNKIWDKIKHGITTAYLHYFDRNLYKSIQLYKKWNTKISTIETQIDTYMRTTSLNERVEKAIAFGVLEEKSGVAQKRMRNIKASKVIKIVAQNQA